MRVARSVGTEPWLELVHLPDPTPGPGEVVLRVDACGICGSDLHMADNFRDHPGVIYGHEFAGTVVAVASDVTLYKENDRLVGFPLVDGQLIGAQRPGAYAEHVAIEAASAFALPDALSADLGALVEPFAVAHHALQSTRREREDPVLILGAGPVGLAIGLWAQVLGARQVVISDPQPARRARAERLGMTAIDPTDQHVGRAYADVTGQRPRTILECIGRPGAIQYAIDLAASEAHVTLVGACQVPDTIQPVVATSKELTLRFVVYYRPADFAQTLDAMTTGALDAGQLITGHVDLDHLPDRFTALMSPNDDCKVLIHPGGTP